MVETRSVLEAARERRKKRRRIIFLSIAGVLVLFIVIFSLVSFTDIFVGSNQDTVESSPGEGQWSMFRRDLYHTGVAGTEDVIPAGNIKWTFSAEGVIHSSPAVVDGIVYFGSRDKHLYAVDAETGGLLWSFPVGSWVESSPVVVDGVVYFGCNDSHVYALDAKTGAEIWKFSTVYAVRSSPAVADGVVYIGSDDRNVYAIDAATGKEKWHKSTGDLVISSPAISQGIVAVGCADGFFYTFSTGSGRSRLEYSVFATINSSPAIKDGVAYFIDIRGRFHAVDITRKNWLWENKIRHYWNALYLYGVAPVPPAASGFLWSLPLAYGPNTASSIALSGDFAYLGVGNNIFSVDLNTHDIAWTFMTEATMNSSPAVTDNAVFFGGQDGHLYALKKANGEKIWDIDIGDIMTSSPAVSDGVLYIGCDDGKLYAIE